MSSLWILLKLLKNKAVCYNDRHNETEANNITLVSDNTNMQKKDKGLGSRFRILHKEYMRQNIEV